MAHYRKKPVVIEAWQLRMDNCPVHLAMQPNIRIFMNVKGMTDPLDLRTLWAEINTPEGTMTANENDFIIKGVNGEFYPCKPDIFEKTYEEVKTFDEVLP